MKKKQIKPKLYQQASTLYLRAALIGGSAIVIFFSSLLGYVMLNEWPVEFPELAWAKYAIVLLVVFIAGTVLLGIKQCFTLLKLVDNDTVFSPTSLKAVQRIQIYSLILGVWFVSGMPVVYAVAEKDDAPGLILLGMIFVAVPFSIAVFAAVVKKLLQRAIDYKNENELTV